MTTVSIEKDLAEDLFDTKLYFIRNAINEILSRWNMTSAEEIIEMTRNGKLEEAELDAISLTNLLDNLHKFENLKIEMGRG